MLEQSPRPRRRFIETPTSRLIRGLLERSRERPEPCLIVGVPGIGKTARIEDIAASDPFARIVTPTPATARNKPFLQDVAGAFHYSTWRKSTPELQSLLWEGLPARAEEGQYLIIDEAQTLDLDASRTALHPWERARLPEAFVGNPAVLKRTRVADPAFKQFADRLHNQLVIPGPTEKDVDSFGIHYNVDFLTYPIIRRFGLSASLRQLEGLLQEARSCCGQTGPIRIAHLSEAMDILRGPDEARRFISHKMEIVK